MAEGESRDIRHNLVFLAAPGGLQCQRVNRGTARLGSLMVSWLIAEVGQYFVRVCASILLGSRWLKLVLSPSEPLLCLSSRVLVTHNASQEDSETAREQPSCHLLWRLAERIRRLMPESCKPGPIFFLPPAHEGNAAERMGPSLSLSLKINSTQGRDAVTTDFSVTEHIALHMRTSHRQNLTRKLECT
ncbi:hypothetical protein BDP81DRAFT_97112 [Colletotrichum phormii]|uniref:Uncharacterized protein n=1 Tax=Colletotrichum phormii TaxID=359342 RepID=A0AAI9ZJ61_9PEZI|nr:uncharacterized protein BDP81DRAFT_97112 [Colletotrichum phormii]KAK1625466.1 hypothetical protein BDP81DRAFT_97112 [Colletotrichum phormii]